MSDKSIVSKIGLITNLTLAIMLIFFSIFFADYLLKPKYILKNIVYWPNFTLNNIYHKIIKVNTIIKFIFSDAVYTYEIEKENLNLNKKINLLQIQNHQLSKLFKNSEKIHKNFNVLIANVVLNKNKQLIMEFKSLYDDNLLIKPNDLIMSSCGVLGKIEEIIKIDNGNFIVFGITKDHFRFNIPVLINNKVAIYHGKDGVIYNLEDESNIKNNDDVFLLAQDGKIPFDILFGKIVKLSDNKILKVNFNDQQCKESEISYVTIINFNMK